MSINKQRLHYLLHVLHLRKLTNPRRLVFSKVVSLITKTCPAIERLRYEVKIVADKAAISAKLAYHPNAAPRVARELLTTTLVICKKPALIYGSQLVASLIFLGYTGYMDLIYNPSSQITANVAAQVTAQKTMIEKTNLKPRGYYGVKRAEIALTQLNGGVAESPMGCNCGPIVDTYTEGHHAQWCTMFASWIAKESGLPFINEKTNSWRLTNSREFAANLKEHGTWYSRQDVINNNIQPRIGDYVVFWRGNFEDDLGHVDIIVELGDEPGTAGLVGGNLDGRVKYRHISYTQNYGFLGIGRPETGDL